MTIVFFAAIWGTRCRTSCWPRLFASTRAFKRPRLSGINGRTNPKDTASYLSKTLKISFAPLAKWMVGFSLMQNVVWYNMMIWWVHPWFVVYLGKYVGNRPIKLRKSNWKERSIEEVRKKKKIKTKLGLRYWPLSLFDFSVFSSVSTEFLLVSGSCMRQ